MNNRLEIGLFGRVAARRGSAEFSSFTTKKGAELFALLALHAGHAVARRDAINLLWPRSQGPKASNRLSATLYGIRQGLDAHLDLGSASIIVAREGTLSLTEDVEVDVHAAESAWQEFKATADESRQSEAAESLVALYRGHLAADLEGTWLEPLRSLWASRWTECVLWRARTSGDHDSALATLSAIQPVLAASRTAVIRYLEEIGRSDLADSWRGSPASNRAVATQWKSGGLKRNAQIFAVPTTTYLMVKGIPRSQIETYVSDAGAPILALDENGYAIPMRNPIAARMVAARLRVEQPESSIYISTRVCNPDDEVPSPLVERYRQVRNGETLLNPPAATLIEMHELDVILERRSGRSEYRLL